MSLPNKEKDIYELGKCSECGCWRTLKNRTCVECNIRKTKDFGNIFDMLLRNKK